MTFHANRRLTAGNGKAINDKIGKLFQEDWMSVSDFMKI
jgi:hypothetical protein